MYQSIINEFKDGTLPYVAENHDKLGPGTFVPHSSPPHNEAPQLARVVSRLTKQMSDGKDHVHATF